MAKCPECDGTGIRPETTTLDVMSLRLSGEEPPRWKCKGCGFVYEGCKEERRCHLSNCNGEVELTEEPRWCWDDLEPGGRFDWVEAIGDDWIGLRRKTRPE